MKAKSTSFPQLLIIPIVAAAFSTAGSICFAQGRDTTTDTATNPHLRSHTAASTEMKVSAKDNGFLVAASTANAREVEDGKIAQKGGTNPEVKRVAARMIADHSKSNKELTDLATRKGVSLNTSGVTAQMMMAPGPEFDRQYLALLETEHKKDISEFEKEAKTGDDSDLKAWANRTLPTLRQHLAMVQDAMRKVR